MATGKYIMYIDSDDLYFENSINESFINKIVEYDKKGVDVILTCKSKTDENCTVDPQLTLPERIEDIRYHMPTNEFWTFIIRKSYMQNKDITFFEYRKQDIETAFRFKVFSRTNNIVSDANIKFYLQRDNLESNTHTFNYYNLYSIKAKVYSELEKEWKKYVIDESKDRESYVFLRRELLHWAYEYYNYIDKNGYTQIHKNQIDEMIDLCKKNEIMPPWKLYGTPIKERVKYYRNYIKIMQYIRKFERIK